MTEPELNVGDAEMASPPDPVAARTTSLLCAWCSRLAEDLDRHGRCAACQRREYAAEIEEAAREEREQDSRWKDGEG